MPDPAADHNNETFLLYFVAATDKSSDTPHPRPLSPEYRGEGRGFLDTLLNALIES